MALDVHVMPLWRFKAGDFTSPIEAELGVKPHVVALEKRRESEPPRWARWLAAIGAVEIWQSDEPTGEEVREQAIRDVEALKSELSRRIGQTVDWRDDGGVHYSKQFHHPVTLRAFAAWVDHRGEMPEFAEVGISNYYHHPVWTREKPTVRRFPTLVGHNMNTGYFLPTPFSGVQAVEPFEVFGGLTFHHDVASTDAVLTELADLRTVLDAMIREPAALRDVRWYAEELQRICELSRQHGLPVIFHG